MSWDMRRLAMSIETAAITLAAASLVIYGHHWIALAAVVLKFVDSWLFAGDWAKHGKPRKN